MNKGLYIQADEKQLIGAKVAKYALETLGGARERGVPVTIMRVEEMPLYTSYTGMTYTRGGETRVHDPKDLQFFTLSRFMPPELMHYDGRAVVIDPDVFALKDVGPLFDMDLGGARVAACRERSWWDTSVMVIDCNKCKDWSIVRLLEGLKNGTEDYQKWMRLLDEPHVAELPRIWNSIDTLTPETNMLHTSNRLTQPWKTGLPVDFTFGTVPKLFGIIPRLWVRHETRYQPHPDKNIEKTFFALLKGAIREGAVTESELDDAMKSGDVRPDARKVLTAI